MNEQRQAAPAEPDDETGDPEALDRQRALGARLRNLFDDVVEEPVPDDFLALLDKLDGAESN